jgi:NOL1/NOP2/fmu family ribosome biogenesis protein
LQKSPNSLLLKDDQKNHLFEYYNFRFGIPKEEMEKFLYINRGDSIWVCSKEIDIPFLKLVDFERVGLRCCRHTHGLFKPATFFVQLMSQYISKSRVEMDKEQLVSFLERESFSTDQACESGYIVTSFENQVIGCGRYKEGKVHSEFPKKITNNMKLSQLRGRFD